MFAMAIWDTEQNVLHLVRDRIGKKPLFVYQRAGLVLFASELKALVASPQFERALNVDALGSYLQYLYIPAPGCIYRNTEKVMPGQIMTISNIAGPTITRRSYWDLRSVYRTGQEDPFEGDEQEATDELERLLQDAVKIRLESDVPLGSLLSGGIDSTTVTALMQRVSDPPVKTYSIGFSSAEHDESKHAARIAEHIGTQHTELHVTGDDALAVVPRLPLLYDEPLSDPSQIPTLLVCGLARTEVTVALTGDGGDELFAGYNRYVAGHRLIRTLSSVPRGMRQLMAGTASGLSPSRVGALLRATGLAPRLVEDKLVKLQRLLSADDEGAMYDTVTSVGWPNPSTVLLPDTRVAGHAPHPFMNLTDAPLLDRMMLSDQASYLPDDLLAKVDRASMAVSLEARVPILDHRVIEFSWRIPAHMKIRNGDGKYLLRRVLDRHVPRELVNRPKVGFSVPLDDWLRGPLHAWAEELFSRIDEPLDGNALRDAWARFNRGEHGLALGLWTAATFQAWRDEWGVT
jgi:asparagine synthase (glutamine-hydrolysing)